MTDAFLKMGHLASACIKSKSVLEMLDSILVST